MIGNNSCGAHSVMAGKTVENVEALEVLTYDGLRLWVGPTSDDEYERIVAGGGRRAEIYTKHKARADKYGELIRTKYPKIKRRVSGYNLDQLLPENGFNVARALVGTEGSCAITLQARTRLVQSPQKRVLLVLGYRDIYVAGDAVPQILPFGPIATEGLDQKIIGGLRVRGMKHRAPADARVRVWAPADRKLLTWLGGSILGSLSTFRGMLVTREQWDEEGPEALHRRGAL
jgi:FAD/FMN-containing dehydrogenase